MSDLIMFYLEIKYKKVHAYRSYSSEEIYIVAASCNLSNLPPLASSPLFVYILSLPPGGAPLSPDSSPLPA